MQTVPVSSSDLRRTLPGDDRHWRSVSTDVDERVPDGRVVTTIDDDACHGTTCSSLASVTLTPPTLLVCLVTKRTLTAARLAVRREPAAHRDRGPEVFSAPRLTVPQLPAADQLCRCRR